MTHQTAPPPDFDELVEDLNRLRLRGMPTLRSLAVPALASAVEAYGETIAGETPTAPAIEELVRRAIADLDGDELSHIAALLFLVRPGSRDYSPAQARRFAADEANLSFNRFRREPEQRIIAQIAEAILRRIHAHQMRLAHVDRQRRTPVTTRLAVKWLERFEAYNRIWTPIYRIGADLTAYRSTMLDRDRPYDDHLDAHHGSTQEDQAVGYVTSALFAHTSYLEAKARFKISHGGLWLFSDNQVEVEVADAVYGIELLSPNNSRDDSYLTILLRRADGEEHNFLNLLPDASIGRGLHQQWQEWAAQCSCTWEHNPDDPEYFPTRRNHPRIHDECEVRAMIEACNDYCQLIDHQWQEIQDWYRADSHSHPGTSAEEMFRRFPPRSSHIA